MADPAASPLPGVTSDCLPATGSPSSVRGRRSRMLGRRHPARLMRLAPSPSRDQVVLALFLVLALLIAPTTAESFDLTLLYASPQHWLEFGVSVLTNWKFGVVYALQETLDLLLASGLHSLGLGAVAALHLGPKLLFVAAAATTAVLLRDITRSAGSHSPTPHLLWLLSPVTLWVAAGQPQVEPMTALFMAGSVRAWQLKRPVLFGILVGLGTGYEYLPAVCLALPLLALVLKPGAAAAKAFLVSGGSFLAALLLQFGPTLLSSTARRLLLLGLTATQAGGAAAPTKSRSLWFPLSVLFGASRLEPLWPVVFLGMAALTLLLVVRRYRHDDPFRAGVVALACLLLLVVVLDPLSLPQFGLLLQLGLLLLIAVGELRSPIVALGIPVAALFSWFLHFSWHQFLLDLIPTLGAYGTSVWPTYPVSYSGYVLLGALASIGSVAVAAYVVARPSSQGTASQPDNRHLPAPGTALALTLAAVLSFTIFLQADQPAALIALLSPSPSHLFDYPFLVNPEDLRTSVTATTDPPGLRATVARSLAQSVSSGNSPAYVSLALSPRPLYSQRHVGAALTSFRAPHIPVGSRYIDTTAVDLQLLVRSDTVLPITSERLWPVLRMSGAVIKASSISRILVNWWRVSYRIPTQVLRGGLVSIASPKGHPLKGLAVNGSRSGTPFEIIDSSSGFLKSSGDQPRTTASFSMSAGSIYLGHWPLAKAVSGIRVPSALCEIGQCSTLRLVARWPTSPELPRMTPIFWLTDVATWLGLLALGYVLFRCFRQAYTLR